MHSKGDSTSMFATFEMVINKRSSLESVLKATQKTIGSKVLGVAERSRKRGY